MTSNYHAAKTFTLTKPPACGIVAVKKFDHNNVSKINSMRLTFMIISYLTCSLVSKY